MSEVFAELERRACGECRVDLAEDRKIRGIAVVFNKLSDNLGGFRERIKPEAVDRTFREGIDVRALVDHETSKVLGRKTAGTLMLRKTPKGLQVEIDPPDTSYARDILQSVDRGDISGMSFEFQVMPEGVEWTEENETPIRDVYDMRIREVSIVTFPAYPQTDVQVAKRSLDAYLRTRRHATKWREQMHEIRKIAGL
jgi:HK97 family phage prohead protease